MYFAGTKDLAALRRRLLVSVAVAVQSMSSSQHRLTPPTGEPPLCVPGSPTHWPPHKLAPFFPATHSQLRPPESEGYTLFTSFPPQARLSANLNRSLFESKFYSARSASNTAFSCVPVGGRGERGAQNKCETKSEEVIGGQRKETPCSNSPPSPSPLSRDPQARKASGGKTPTPRTAPLGGPGAHGREGREKGVPVKGQPCLSPALPRQHVDGEQLSWANDAQAEPAPGEKTPGTP